MLNPIARTYHGIHFQIPVSNFSRFRFTVHPDGSGTSWDEDSPDVGQPHGLDYRSLQDLRKGIRKRLEHEHADLGDNTVGGIHNPGGCAVLGIEDGTATIVADGTLHGHGIVWDNTARLWCSTAAAGASTTGDFTLVQIHPDKQWGGQDITWTGGHEFDASIDITGNVALDGDFSVDGMVYCNAGLVADGTVQFTGQINIFGTDNTEDSDNASLANDVTYQVSSDGFLVVDVSHAGNSVNYRVFVDTTKGMTTTSSKYEVNLSQAGVPVIAGQTVILPKNSYWCISITAGSLYRCIWYPLGDGSCDKNI